MNTIFMNSKNSKTYDPHRILLNLTGKIKVTNMLLHQILAYTKHGKI